MQHTQTHTHTHTHTHACKHKAQLWRPVRASAQRQGLIHTLGFIWAIHQTDNIIPDYTSENFNMINYN